MVNTIWKENFLIMCSKLCLNARDSGHFAQLLLICRNYSLQILCGAPHNVCNEEGKLIGMEGNRRIGDGSSIIAGPFFICGTTEEDFRGLTDSEVDLYMDRFKEPEQISPEEVSADTGCTIIFSM